MKKKLTTLLFGLLLAVGWTSNASAQSSPNNHSDAVHPKSYYDALTYTWENPTDGKGVRTSKSTDLATDPYQIYELLRFVYGNPAFPGPNIGPLPIVSYVRTPSLMVPSKVVGTPLPPPATKRDITTTTTGSEFMVLDTIYPF